MVNIFQGLSDKANFRFLEEYFYSESQKSIRKNYPIWKQKKYLSTNGQTTVKFS